MATGILEDLQTITTTGAANGHVLDTAFIDTLVFEVRWSLSATPTQLNWFLQGSNDASITPDVTLKPAAAEWNLSVDIDGYTIKGALQTDGRGLVVYKDLPRYVKLDTYTAGSFTGTITVRAFATTR